MKPEQKDRKQFVLPVAKIKKAKKQSAKTGSVFLLRIEGASRGFVNFETSS